MMRIVKMIREGMLRVVGWEEEGVVVVDIVVDVGSEVVVVVSEGVAVLWLAADDDVGSKRGCYC